MIFAHDRPILGDELHDEVLTKLIELLSPVGERRRARKDDSSQNKRRRTALRSPERLPHIDDVDFPFILGFNAVMAAVEKGTELCAIIVTRPPSMVTHHFPKLCSGRGIKLLALKEGSEAQLGKTVGLPRIGVIGVLEPKPELSVVLRQISLVEPSIAEVYRPVQVETTTQWIPIQSKEKNQKDK